MEVNLNPSLEDLSDDELIELIHKKILENLSSSIVRSNTLRNTLRMIANNYNLDPNGDIVIFDKVMYYINISNNSFRIIRNYAYGEFDIDINDIKIIDNTPNRYNITYRRQKKDFSKKLNYKK